MSAPSIFSTTPQSLSVAVDGGTSSGLVKLAAEHVLCEQCHSAVKNSVTLKKQHPSRGSERFCRYAGIDILGSSILSSGSAGAGAATCHLCCLILGAIRQQQQTPIANGPADVTINVSRSGGITFSIQVEEGGRQRNIGELVIVPQDYLEGLPTSPASGFAFPDQSSHIYQNAQLALSLASEPSFCLARAWLQQCLQKHSKCTEAAGMAVGRPSRLIDVGSETGRDPRVVVMQHPEEGLEYLTLSHCWGGAKILRLLVENFDQLITGIPMSSLPKTFQDAVIITRRLGYRYIWIDSLCIIQDSPSDWRSCAAVMGEIYAGSVCTISALTARNAYDGGCFFDHMRNPLSFRPCRLTEDWWVEGNTNVGPDLRVGLSPMPLHTRAWVVQERILAPRTLYYGSNGLAWECVECSATEAVPMGEVSRFSPKASFFATQKRGSDPEEYYNQWTDIQIAYTRCLLTRFDDRLVAISGVIKRIEKLTGWTNMWGMWKERLLQDLLWFVEEPTKGRPQTDEYLSPTWSWAGIEGRVMLAVGGSKETCHWMADDINVGLSDDGKHGCIRLRAMMKAVSIGKSPSWQLNPGIDAPSPKWEEVDWDPDVTPGAGDMAKEVRCVLIARVLDYLGPGSEAMDIGLVVVRHGKDWIRIGVFRQLREGSALFGDHKVDTTELTIL
ncbi:heterokaryon incompatibility protein-domain-containing protein [Collybia nuda]|uniref:Heterokaryon incompatibility protein-domain-containing protein n=1 Tax=Collybia nuda TaxID=64659 RepID=A0A9P6CFT6_9AGAR|nr:heterokaryon incompatibility protein-domain-containing protein [Collybia nuda]